MPTKLLIKLILKYYCSGIWLQTFMRVKSKLIYTFRKQWNNLYNINSNKKDC